MQASAWLLLVLSLPCLVSTSCFAPDSPRFLLYRNDKTACVDSLQWLRGSLSDLAGEFTQISNKLENALGSRWKCFVTWSTIADLIFRSLFKSLKHKSIYRPVLLCFLLISLSSMSCFQSFSLLFITNFSGKTLSVNLVMVDISIKMCGCLAAVLLSKKVGVKLMLLLGK